MEGRGLHPKAEREFDEKVSHILGDTGSLIVVAILMCAIGWCLAVILAHL